MTARALLEALADEMVDYSILPLARSWQERIRTIASSLEWQAITDDDWFAGTQEEFDCFDNYPTNVKNAILRLDSGEYDREAWAIVRLAFRATNVDAVAYRVVLRDLGRVIAPEAKTWHGVDLVEAAAEHQTAFAGAKDEDKPA